MNANHEETKDTKALASFVFVFFVPLWWIC